MLEGGEKAMYPLSCRSNLRRRFALWPPLQDEKVLYPLSFNDETISRMAGSTREAFFPTFRFFQFDASSSPNLLEWARGKNSLGNIWTPIGLLTENVNSSDGW